MLSGVPSTGGSILDFTKDTDAHDDSNVANLTPSAQANDHEEMGEISTTTEDGCIEDADTDVEGLNPDLYARGKRKIVEVSKDRIGSSEAVDLKSRRVPKPLAVYWDLLTPSYRRSNSSPSVSTKANMTAETDTRSPDRGLFTHGSFLVHTQHNRTSLQIQSAGYPFSSPAGLLRHMSPSSGPGDGSESNAQLSQQVAPVEFPEESNVDPGLLSVQLLKHQRIALHWMVERESKLGLPYGGILADDQGLGKTISMISLILKTRAPVPNTRVKSSSLSALEAARADLGDNDYSHPVGANVFDTSADETTNTGTGLAAGTLVVCPTSVLRQWASECKDKVNEAAGLSVLVYHGSSRKRDPEELAKYDIVLTTYSIISMEVPAESTPCNVPPMRKKSKKTKFTEGNNGSIYWGPLARVNWFRVVLDEAQSIKNSGTQVARAAWGLRAERRWCLSGTPIQNTIDDLFSYFRFLRFSPYDGYSIFRHNIKVRIARCPKEGFRALQGLLSTVMLRRTKDTVIDGAPIVRLPQKIVSLKQMELSEDERMFYTRIEIESCRQFQVYTDAGTVKSNYANILVMILHLRQACSHWMLVKGHKVQSANEITMDSARALPLEQRSHLLSLLESNNAICPLCENPPDDAVACICTHIFCWQCICEHLAMGEDACCPVPNCTRQLGLSSIFTSSSLKGIDGDAGSSTSGAIIADETPDDSRNPEETRWRPSSKIKAVMEALHALPKVTLVVNKGKLAAEISQTTPDVGIGNHKEPASSGIAAAEVKISASDAKAEPSTCSSILTDLQTSDSADTQSSNSGGTEDVSDLMGCNDTVTSVFIDTTEKAIVFSQWTSMLDLLEISLKQTNIKYRRLDGTMSILAREWAVAEFQTLPEVTVIIMLKAASLGLNMISANHVLLMDLWWNPTLEDQATDRAHRIGQKKTVHVSRFTMKNTIEGRILALQERKRELVASALGSGIVEGEQDAKLSPEDFKYLFTV
ncbi:hypothetical protein R1flu_027508 [Riccia fluitans]|uniref:Helicase-like transcription factor CHR28 n=1 Tax=Riccia fluitans TaxID=41844 RepID=A0ABD1XJI5_9MARC